MIAMIQTLSDAQYARQFNCDNHRLKNIHLVSLIEKAPNLAYDRVVLGRRQFTPGWIVFFAEKLPTPNLRFAPTAEHVPMTPEPRYRVLEELPAYHTQAHFEDILTLAAEGKINNIGIAFNLKQA